MKCQKCQFENPDRSLFYGEYGSSSAMEVVCPRCGSKAPSIFKFCNRCEQSLGNPKTSPPLDPSRPSSYTPKHLADQILTSRSAVEGERKIVTVLFAYTPLPEKLNREEVTHAYDHRYAVPQPTPRHREDLL
jgi:hypothetical protein